MGGAKPAQRNLSLWTTNRWFDMASTVTRTTSMEAHCMVWAQVLWVNVIKLGTTNIFNTSQKQLGSNYGGNVASNTSMYLSHLGMNLKIPEQYKSGSRIRNHSRTATSTSWLLWNRRHPKCWFSNCASSIFHHQFLPSFCVRICPCHARPTATRLMLAS